MDAARLVELLHEGPYKAETIARVRDALTDASGPNQDPPVGGSWRSLLVAFAGACEAPGVAAAAHRLAGDLAQQQGEDTFAAEHYADALALDPTDDGLAESLVERGLPERASYLVEVLSARVESLSERDVEDEQMGAAYRLLAKVRLAMDDRDGVIDALDQAVDFDPALATTEQLVEHYLARANPGDEEQAADLLCAIAAALPDVDAVGYLERALDVMPDHDESMERLEGLVPEAEQVRRLRVRWVRYIERAGNDADADGRRVRLARALMAEERYRDALLCVAPAADRGSAEGIGLRSECLASLEQQAAMPQGSPERPMPAGRALRPRSGQTMLGIDLSAHRADGRIGEHRVLPDGEVGSTVEPGTSRPAADVAADAPGSARVGEPSAGDHGGLPSSQPAGLSPLEAPRSQPAAPVPVPATGAGSPLHPELRSSRPPKPSVGGRKPVQASDVEPRPAEQVREEARAPAASGSAKDAGGATGGHPAAPSRHHVALVAAVIMGLGAVMLLSRSEGPPPEEPAAERPAPPTSPAAADAPAPSGRQDSRRADGDKGMAQTDPASPALAIPAAAGGGPTNRPTAAPPAADPVGQPGQPVAAMVDDPAAAEPEPQTTTTATTEPEVRIGPVGLRVTGGRLPLWSVKRDLSRAMPLLRGCYRSALARAPDLRGEMVYSLRVDTEGRVSRLQRRGGTIEDSNLVGCASSVLRSTAFRPPEDATVQIRIPVVYGD